MTDPIAPQPESMEPERWWQRSAVKGAIGTAVGLWLPVLSGLIETGVTSRGAMSAAVTGTIVAGLSAWGVVVADRAGYRRG